MKSNVGKGMTVVPKCWPGGTIAILASGPSLTLEDVAYVRGKADAVIAINRTYQAAPWADVLYGSDAHKFWTWHESVPEFQGMKFTVWTDAGRKKVAEKIGVPALMHTGYGGLELDPSGLRTGKNSAYAAVNLAVHFGATRIVLLGVDLMLGPRQERHWHADYQDKSVPPIALALTWFPTLVEPLKTLGIEVLNCTRRTALSCFPRVPLEQVL